VEGRTFAHPYRSIRAERALAVPPLWRGILSALRQKVVRQIGQNLECARQSLSLLAQNDFVAAAEDSTSLPLSRNCFGRRTAWLLPDQKTRAVAI
jgi:hypothetical protein